MEMQTDLKKELDSLVALIQSFTKEGCFGCISERVFFTFYLLKRVSRIKYIVDKHMKTSINTIIDESGIDYVLLSGQLSTCVNLLNTKFHGGYLKSDNPEDIDDETGEKIEYTLDEVVENESDYKADGFDRDDFRIAQNSLLKSSITMFDNVVKTIGSIIVKLNDIKEHNDNIRKNIELLYNNIMDDYSKNVFPSRKEITKSNLRIHLSSYEKKDKLTGVMKFRDCLLNTMDNRDKEFATSSNPCSFLLKVRHELNEDSLKRIMYNKYMYEYLDGCIKYFGLSSPGRYKILFVNAAAERLVEALLPTILKYGKFKYEKDLSSIFLVLEDLGLSDKNKKRRGGDFRELINKHINVEQQISDTKTISNITNKVVNMSFKMHQQSNLTEETRDLWDKLHDDYWCTLSIINKVLGYNLKSMHFAGYLQSPHPKSIAIDNFYDSDGRPIDKRLLFLYRDILNGSITEFLSLK